jgi:hypothetical protein
VTAWPSLPSETPNGVAKPAALPTIVGTEALPPPSPANPMARVRLNGVGDTAKELRKIYRECRAGTLATSEATKLAYLLTTLANLMVTSSLEDRLAALESAKASR